MKYVKCRTNLHWTELLRICIKFENSCYAPEVSNLVKWATECSKLFDSSISCEQKCKVVLFFFFSIFNFDLLCHVHFVIYSWLWVEGGEEKGIIVYFITELLISPWGTYILNMCCTYVWLRVIANQLHWVTDLPYMLPCAFVLLVVYNCRYNWHCVNTPRIFLSCWFLIQ